jgi:hypothetical protein
MFKRKGQNIAEYSILIALVIAAAVGMQLYIKRGLQGRIADATDTTSNLSLGDDATLDTLVLKTKQYEPYYTNSSSDVKSYRGLNETYASKGYTNRSMINETTTRAGGTSWEKEEFKGFNASTYDSGR